MAGFELKGKPSITTGCTIAPYADDKAMDDELKLAEEKIKAGAQFIQTQAVYNPETFEKFMAEIEKFNIPVMAGIVVLKSARMAQFMNENIAGINVPESVIQEMDVPKEERSKKAIEISARILKNVKPLCHGAHIMALGWEKYIPAIIEAAGV